MINLKPHKTIWLKSMQILYELQCYSANLKWTCTSVCPFVQFKFSVYGLTYVRTGHTCTRDLQCSHTSVWLAQARPNKRRNYVLESCLSWDAGTWAHNLSSNQNIPVPALASRNCHLYLKCCVVIFR